MGGAAECGTGAHTCACAAAIFPCCTSHSLIHTRSRTPPPSSSSCVSWRGCLCLSLGDTLLGHTHRLSLPKRHTRHIRHDAYTLSLQDTHRHNPLSSGDSVFFGRLVSFLSSGDSVFGDHEALVDGFPVFRTHIDILS